MIPMRNPYQKAMNPYWGSNFFQFFHLLFVRLMMALRGDLALSDLASDEVQLLVLLGVAISTSLVGVLLVLRRMTMLANSLSHTTLLGLVIAYIIFLPLSTHSGQVPQIDVKILMSAAFLSALLTAFCTEFLRRVCKLQEDASISLVFTTFFALGVTLVTLFARNAHLEIDAVMGNVDALHIDDLKPVGIVVGINLILIVLFFKEWKITTFDSALAKALGISPLFFSTLLLFQTSATLMGSFRAVGVLLVLAFLVVSPLSARLLTHRLGRLFVIAPLLTGGCSIASVALSRHLLSVYHMPLSTAGLVVMLLALLYGGILLSSLTFRKKRGIILANGT